MGRVPREFRDEAAALTTRLHAEGWASHVSVEWLLQDWEQLAAEASAYPATIDDYTNDVTSRDALEIVVASASAEFAAYMRDRIGTADERFVASTSDDGGAAVGQYFRIERKQGRWWHRRSSTGPLSDYLDRA
jgi:hypothetical protein